MKLLKLILKLNQDIFILINIIFILSKNILKIRSPKSKKIFCIVLKEERLNSVYKALENKGVTLFYLSRGFIDVAFNYYLDDYIRDPKGRDFWIFKAYKMMPRERALFIRHNNKLFRLLKKITLKAKIFLLLPKYNDDYTLDLLNSAYMQDIWTVVYDREGMPAKHREVKISKVISGIAAPVNHVITYNKNHTNFFKNIFGKINSESIIDQIGYPLLDNYLCKGKIKSNKPFSKKLNNILFFAFGPISAVLGEEFINSKEDKLPWENMLKEIHDELSTYLYQNPSNFLIYRRSKRGTRDYSKYSEKILNLKNCIEPNSETSSINLIAEANKIIVFQSTALIEALYSEKVIIYPGWSSYHKELVNKGILHNHNELWDNNLIYFANSPKNFYELLVNSKPPTEKQKAKRIEYAIKFTNNRTGNVGEIAANKILERFKKYN